MSKNKKFYIMLSVTLILLIILFPVSVALIEKFNNWIMFIIATPITIVLFVYTVYYYVKHTKFLCPKCGAKFKPKAITVLMAIHTPTKRKLKCSKCNTVSWCKDYIE